MKLRSKTIITLIVIIIMMGLAWEARAEDQVKMVTVSFTIQDTVSMEIDNLNINLGRVTPLVDKGAQEMKNAHRIKVRANRKWRLTAQAQDDFKGATQSTIIPIKQFKVRKSGDNYQTFLSKNAAVVIASGEVTTNQGTDVSIDYQLDVSWEHPAGNYSTQIVYTLSVNP